MVIPGVVIFASKYDCSNPCRVQYMSLFVFFFQKVFRKPKFNFVSKIELHNPVVGGCQSTLKVSGVANLASENDCSNLCSFRDLMSFRIFQRTKIFNYLVRLFRGIPRSCDFCFQI